MERVRKQRGILAAFNKAFGKSLRAMRNREISPEVAAAMANSCASLGRSISWYIRIKREIHETRAHFCARNKSAQNRRFQSETERVAVKEVSLRKARNTRRLILTVLRRRIKRRKLRYCRSIWSLFYSATKIRYFPLPLEISVSSFLRVSRGCEVVFYPLFRKVLKE